MKLKKTTGMILSAMLIAVSLPLTGCSVKKDVTIIVKVPQLTMDVSVIGIDCGYAYDMLETAGADFAAQYEDANVTVEVEQYENTEESKSIKGCYGTEDAADVLYDDYFSMKSHIYEGCVVPVDDIISDDIRKDIDDDFWVQSAVNGKTYMMPFLYRQNVLCYNKDWFKKAGLDKYISDKEEVQTWTMEEWEEILSALRDSMPEGSYPLMMYARNNQGDTHTMCYLRSQGSKFFNDAGEIDLETKEGIAGLRWIKDCVDKRYMPKNAEYLEILDIFDMFQDGQIAIYVGNTGLEPSFKVDYGYVNFPTTDGGCNTSFVTGFQVFDNGDQEKVEVSKAFVKYMYESKYLDYSASNIPCSKKTAAKYARELKPVQKYLDNTGKDVNFTGEVADWLGIREVYYPHIQDLINGTKTPEEVAKELDEDCNKVIREGKENSRIHE